MMSVEESCMLMNQKNGNSARPMGMICPHCQTDNWQTYHGIDSQYASQYNPGEYVDFICENCGFTDQQAS
jgi:hypothetical protein